MTRARNSFPCRSFREKGDAQVHDYPCRDDGPSRRMRHQRHGVCGRTQCRPGLLRSGGNGSPEVADVGDSVGPAGTDAARAVDGKRLPLGNVLLLVAVSDAGRSRVLVPRFLGNGFPILA